MFFQQFVEVPARNSRCRSRAAHVAAEAGQKSFQVFGICPGTAFPEGGKGVLPRLMRNLLWGRKKIAGLMGRESGMGWSGRRSIAERCAGKTQPAFGQ